MRYFFFIIAGILAIEAKAAACSEGQHWVRAYHRRAYYRADGTFVAATQVTAHCQGNPD